MSGVDDISVGAKETGGMFVEMSSRSIKFGMQM